MLRQRLVPSLCLLLACGDSGAGDAGAGSSGEAPGPSEASSSFPNGTSTGSSTGWSTTTGVAPPTSSTLGETTSDSDSHADSKGATTDESTGGTASGETGTGDGGECPAGDDDAPTTPEPVCEEGCVCEGTEIEESGTGELDPGRLGESCGPSGQLACDVEDPQLALVCMGGTWAQLQSCEGEERCDRRSGVCAPVLPACADRPEDYTYCTGTELHRCRSGGVYTQDADCCGLCVEGACEAPYCGNGRIEADETCDDGNRIAADGCENDCAPSRVLGLAAGLTHTCASLRHGVVRCWGGNDHGQLGSGHADPVADRLPYTLDPIAFDAPIDTLVAGTNHTCVLLETGEVHCWGLNASGQLGLGHGEDIGDDERPGPEASLVRLGEACPSAVALAAGGDVTCAVLEGGELQCWGDNAYGQLGLGHTERVGDDELPSIRVDLDEAVVDVAVGGEHVCAILETDRIRCWGRNHLGQLGLGHTDDIGDDELPREVDVVPMWYDQRLPIDVVASNTHNCALTTDEWGHCWGYNGNGELGLGSVIHLPEATPLDRGLLQWDSPPVQFSAGAQHTCVRLANHRVRCWGVNDRAQLGLPNLDNFGDSENMMIFPAIDLGVDDRGAPLAALEVQAGERHTCALLETGSVLCWGYNANGQLGLGYASAPPVDYVGGDPEHLPGLLPAVEVLPPG